MALTITINKRGYFGDLQYVQGTFLADTSWLAAGESLTPGDLGLDHITMFNVEEQGGIVFHWSRSVQAVLAYRTGSGENAVLTAVADSQDISAIATAVEFFVFGW